MEKLFWLVFLNIFYFQVNKDLAILDGVRIVSETEKLPFTIVKDGKIITDMDKPEAGECEEAKELILVRNMLIAAVEERYIDAAKLRDELQQFRSISKKQKQT